MREGKQLVIAPDTATRPPPYAPPSTDIKGIYPTIRVTGGTIHLSNPDDNDSTPVQKEGIHEAGLDMNRSLKHPHVTLPLSGQTPLTQYTEPFADRQVRERTPSCKSSSGEWEKDEYEDSYRKEQAPNSHVPEGIKHLVHQQREEIEYLRALQNETERTHMSSHPGNRVTLSADITGRWKKNGTNTKMSTALQGEWEDDIRQEDDEREKRNKGYAQLSRQIEALDESLKTQIDELEKLDHPQAGLWYGRLRSSTAKGEGTVQGQYPLVRQSGGGDKYRPFGIGDVQAIVDKLPPVVEGGSLWLGKLDMLTAGHRLAVGDFRAIASRCMTSGDLRDIETDAQLNRVTDDTAFTRHSTVVGQAMRDKFPLPNATVMPKMRWDPKTNPRTYINESKELWAKHTGCHPGKAGAQREWFRQAVLEGVPVKVKELMVKNPDMLGCDSHVWEKHLVHHLTAAQDDTHKDQKEMEDLQAQFLRLQLKEARDKVNDKKPKCKPDGTRIMVASVQDPPTPDLFPVPSWEPQPRPRPPHIGYPIRGGQRGGQGGQRWGGRGRPGRGGQRATMNCFLCNSPGHWAKDCQLHPMQQQGRGRSSGAPALNRTGQAMTQYPVWEDPYSYTD